MAGDEHVQKSAEQVEQKIDASNLTPEQKEEAKRGYAEWAKEKGHNIYESWMPWIEDQYLGWFTKDNKASYATKREPLPSAPLVSLQVPIITQLAIIVAKYWRAEQLDKTKVTNIEGVNKLQDDVNSLVSGQIGKGGLFQPVGDAFSKEGINRAERDGMDEKGGYLPSSMSSVENAGKSAASGASEGAKTGGGYLSSAGSYVSGAGSSVYGGAKGAAGYVGGIFGGKKDATDASGQSQDAANEGAEESGEEGAQETAKDTTKQATRDAKPAQQRTRSMIDQAEEESKPASKADTSTATDTASKGAGAVQNGAQAGAGALQDGVRAGGGYVSGAGNAAKGAGGYVTGMFGK
jgi:hypothetical protein